MNMMQKKFISVLSFAVLLAAGADPVKGGSDDTINVGTYNIRLMHGDRNTPNAWKERKDGLVGMIDRLDLDVFGMQEVLPLQAAYITNALPRYAVVGDYRNEDRVSGEASSVCYRKDRFELLKTGTFWLSETPDVPGKKGWGAACPRVCTWAILRDRKSGKMLTFANAHTDHISKLARLEGMKLICRRMRDFSPDGQPIVFTGDHNCRESEESALTVSKVLNDAIYASVSAPKGVWRTFNAWKWRDSDVLSADALKMSFEERAAKSFKGGGRIDYIYVSKGVTVLNYEVHSDPRPGTKLYPSDHFPVSAEIRLP